MKKWTALGFAIIAAVMLLLLPNTPKTQYYHNQGKIFGTYYNIRYEATEDCHDSVMAALKAVDQSLSMFNSNSVISKINRNDSVVLDSLFMTMFNEAQAISQLSDGAFDITVAPLVNAWGFGTKSQEPRTKNQDIHLDSIKALVGYHKVHLDNHCLLKDDGRITLDASAIAKGYACDVVANTLRRQGCENLLVHSGLGIYDTMQLITPDVATICTGMAASMGSVLLCAGAQGKRSALPHSRVMIHQPLGGARGQASDILIAAEEIRKTRDELCSIIADHSGQSIDKVLADADRDFWMTSQQALDYGMIDGILRGKKKVKEG